MTDPNHLDHELFMAEAFEQANERFRLATFQLER
jgi:hypothetical protein